MAEYDFFCKKIYYYTILKKRNEKQDNIAFDIIRGIKIYDNKLYI
jgi:hypothetical protein